jgi:hypothetical protein
MIYRVTIKGTRPWRKFIEANSEYDAMRKALKSFRSERGYEPSRAEDIYVAPDINQFFKGGEYGR